MSRRLWKSYESGLETSGGSRGVMNGFVTLFSHRLFFSPDGVSEKTKRQSPLPKLTDTLPWAFQSDYYLPRCFLPVGWSHCIGCALFPEQRTPLTSWGSVCLAGHTHFPFASRNSGGNESSALHTRSNSFPIEWWRQSGHRPRESLCFKASKCVLGLRVGLSHIMPWSFTTLSYALLKVIQPLY